MSDTCTARNTTAWVNYENAPVCPGKAVAKVGGRCSNGCDGEGKLQ